MPTADLGRSYYKPVFNSTDPSTTLIMTPVSLLCFLLLIVKLVQAAPADGFVFPDERKERKLEPVITPPVLPVLEHLERDPSTLRQGPQTKSGVPQGLANPSQRLGPKPKSEVPQGRVNPRFGFGGTYSVQPSNGGLTASVSSSASGAGASQSASQSFSFGFNQGFSASHSASQASSFNGFGNGFSGSQASSQAASFSGSGGSLSAASSSAGAQGGGSGSQSASSAFGFNSLNGTPPNDEVNFGDGLLDIRHRGAPNFPFPPSFGGRGGVGAAAIRTGKRRPSQRGGIDEFLTILVSD